MCKIITIINKNKANNSKIQKIIEANITALSSERSGYSVFKNNKSYFYLGDKAYKNIAVNLKYDGSELFIIHTRTKTAGSDDIDGLHLQTLADRFVYAHNGIVRRFIGVKKHNDSFYFFRRLIKNPLTPVRIETAVNHYGFSGRAFLYDLKDRKLHIIVNHKLYITALPNCLIFTSYELNLQKKAIKTTYVLGYPFSRVEKNVPIPVSYQGATNDCYMRFEDGVLKEKFGIEAKTATAYNYLSSTWYTDREDAYQLFSPYKL